MAKNKRYSIRIPNKLSGMLRAAVADMAAVEKDPRYKLNMFDWHLVWEGKCQVCMAGAVLAMRGKADPRITVRPYHQDVITEATADKMRAINEMREGNFDSAMQCLDKGWDWFDAPMAVRDTLDKASRAVNSEFKRDIGRATPEAYLKAADILQAAGL